MTDMLLSPAALCGRMNAPPSKSAAHRALLCAALSGANARVSPVSRSADMQATLGVLAAMGVGFVREKDAVVFSAREGFSGERLTLDCKESGSTLRFLLPVAAALGLQAVFTGAGRLPERPLGVLTRQLEAHGVSFSAPQLPFLLSGQLCGGRFSLPGDVSSQFISGLLFALPLLPEGGELVVSGALQSAGYVSLTLAALADAGVPVQSIEGGWRIAGGARYRGGNYFVEGDYSNAAFWLCAGALSCPAGESLTVDGLAADSVQGDRAVADCLRRFGAQLEQGENAVTVRRGEAPLIGCRIDAAPIPDLIPVLAVVAAFARGDTIFENAARLRMKESDRIFSTAAMVRALGGAATEYPDRLVVRGSGGAPLAGGVADGMNDHRIVMSAAAAACACAGPVRIRGAQAIDKSYPEFFKDYAMLGGKGEAVCPPVGETV